MDDGTAAQPPMQRFEVDGQTAESESPISGQAASVPYPSLPSRPVIWLRLIRPAALLLVLFPALTALALLWTRGARIMALPAVAGLLSLTLVQAGASLLDVYLEYARRARLPDSDRYDLLTARALLAHSGAPPLNVLRVSIALLALGALVGIPLVVSGGWSVVLLGVVGLAIAFLFSATAFALKRFSLADLLVGLALGPGIITGMMLAQRHSPTGRDLLLGCALGLLAMLPAVGAHLRDAQQDKALGRRTLVTTLGDGVGRAIYALCLLAGFALLVFAALPRGAPHGALLGFFALPAFSTPLTGVFRAKPGRAREQIVLQELRAYAVFGFWLLLGLAINDMLISGLVPIPPTV